MKIASLAEVKARLSAFLDEAGSTGPVVITRNGRAVAVLIAPVDDDDLERLLLSRSPRFQALLAKSRASLRAGRGVAHETIWKVAETPVAEPTPSRPTGARRSRSRRSSRPA